MADSAATTKKKSPLFMTTSTEKPSILSISFASDPTGSLGAQLINLDKGQTEEMFSPGYACVGRLLDGETVARKCGVAVGDVIVGVNGLGFRRFKPEYKLEELHDVTTKFEGMTIVSSSPSDGGGAEEEGGRVVSGKGDGEAYKLMLAKIKEVKKAAASADPTTNALHLSLERYGWDSRVNAWPRYLVARDGDVPAAMLMQQTHEQWRDTIFPIDLTDKGLQTVIDSKAVSEIDVTNNSSNNMGTESLPPSVYVNFSKLQSLQQDGTIQVEDVVRAFVIFTETLLSRSSNPRQPKMSQLIDLSGVSITNAGGFRTDLLKEIYGTFEPNYPETLHKMVLYPVSKVVASTAKVMLNFVNEKTRQKFVITDDLTIVCDALGWSKTEVEDSGGVTEFMHKHAKAGDSFLVL